MTNALLAFRELFAPGAGKVKTPSLSRLSRILKNFGRSRYFEIEIWRKALLNCSFFRCIAQALGGVHSGDCPKDENGCCSREKCRQSNLHVFYVWGPEEELDPENLAEVEATKFEPEIVPLEEKDTKKEPSTPAPNRPVTTDFCLPNCC